MNMTNEKSLTFYYPIPEEANNISRFQLQSSKIIGFKFKKNNIIDIKKNEKMKDANYAGIYFLFFNNANENTGRIEQKVIYW